MRVNIPFNVVTGVKEIHSKFTSNMATRLKNQPKKREHKTRMNM